MFIQNDPAEGPGTLHELFVRDGLDATVHRAWRNVPTNADGPVVILGGPQSANDDLPYLRAQEELVRDCHARGVPVLGVCLGAQLAAKALGGRVYPGMRPEAGFYTDVIPDRNSRLFRNADIPYVVFHWHGDTFDLPPGAVRLAGSRTYENQAFRCGSVVGLQFHLEVDARMAELWGPRMGENRPPDPDRMRDLRRNMESFHGNFRAQYGI